MVHTSLKRLEENGDLVADLQSKDDGVGVYDVAWLYSVVVWN